MNTSSFSKGLAIAALVAAGWCAWNELEWLGRNPVSKVLFTLSLAIAALAMGVLSMARDKR